MIYHPPLPPHGRALGSGKLRPNSPIALKIAHFSIYWWSWCLSKFHYISLPFFVRFWFDFGSIFDPFWHLFWSQIVIKSRLFFHSFSVPIFHRFSNDFAGTLIWPTSFGSAKNTVFLQCFLHVGLVGLTSLIYAMLATTGLEIQYFSARIFINFPTILASKIH